MWFPVELYEAFSSFANEGIKHGAMYVCFVRAMIDGSHFSPPEYQGEMVMPVAEANFPLK